MTDNNAWAPDPEVIEAVRGLIHDNPKPRYVELLQAVGELWYAGVLTDDDIRVASSLLPAVSSERIGLSGFFFAEWAHQFKACAEKVLSIYDGEPRDYYAQLELEEEGRDVCKFRTELQFTIKGAEVLGEPRFYHPNDLASAVEAEEKYGWAMVELGDHARAAASTVKPQYRREFPWAFKAQNIDAEAARCFTQVADLMALYPSFKEFMAMHEERCRGLHQALELAREIADKE